MGSDGMEFTYLMGCMVAFCLRDDSWASASNSKLCLSFLFFFLHLHRILAGDVFPINMPEGKISGRILVCSVAVKDSEIWLRNTLTLLFPLNKSFI